MLLADSYAHTLRLGNENTVNLSYNNVKCRVEMLHEFGLALEKCRANLLECNINFRI